MKQYTYNLLIAFDEFANCLFGGAPSDTLSGRAMRGKEAGVWVWTWIYDF